MTKKTSAVKEAWEDYIGNDPNSLKYPKRLIEVDLPIARISAHARREKSIRHGHISTLHIWWARRPLAACRAVICASLWPDPADPLCPQAFRDTAVKHIKAFAARAASGSLPTGERPKLNEEQAELERGLSPESQARWEAIAKGTLTLDPSEPNDMGMLRFCLLDFIADFSNWDNSTVSAYLETCRALTSAAHESLGGIPGSKPLVMDPFAGGGSIPLEALRVGADAFASDLNPVAVLLNKAVIELVPKYGKRLADEVKRIGEIVRKQAVELLQPHYVSEQKAATPIAFLWSRVVLSDAPGLEIPTEVPLLRSMWLCKKQSRKVAMRWVRDSEGRVLTETETKVFADGQKRDILKPRFEIFEPETEAEVEDGTVARGTATCPVTGYTTTLTSVRSQLMSRRGGAIDARMLAVVFLDSESSGRQYRLPTPHDEEIAAQASDEINSDAFRDLVPSAAISLNELRRISVPIYGMELWRDLFTHRQLLALATLSKLVRALPESNKSIPGLSQAIKTFLAFAVDRQANATVSLARWNTAGEKIEGLFSRQAIGMVWDFAEVNPLSGSTGDFGGALEWVHKVIEANLCLDHGGTVEQAGAVECPLPDDAADAVITDPPYYDAVPYAHLSDFFYVWLRITLAGTTYPFLSEEAVPKSPEIVVDRPHRRSSTTKGIEFYEAELTRAFCDSRRIAKPSGIATIVFASKSTASWEAILQAVVDAGWTVTGSWPIDTEMGSRVAAQGQARLASSVHMVCRPREDATGKLRSEIGEWRDVLSQLPVRIHQWMPRLAMEGVVGADAIFACLGPALEIFSKYSRVEKSNGDAATLREYLEHVWAAVSTEALALIFRDADASGLEPDARLTAMWMWTIGGGKDENDGSKDDGGKLKPSDGYTLEFDAARKIAQGLGVHLEQCTSLVEIKGDQAKLLPVSARTRHLFGTDSSRSATGRSAKVKQRTLFDELDDAEAAEPGWTQLKGPPPGSTTLDRVHQAMILFAANRGELLKRFLVDDGVGKEARFWKLADNLNKLYPTGTEERRWIEGVLARKRGLGL